MKLQLFFDGGTRLSNPGDGYGSFVLESGDYVLARGQEIDFGPNRTNNESEYFSLVHGLRAASSYQKDCAVLSVFSDSKLVVNQIKGIWACKKKELRLLRAEALGLLQYFKSWTIEWNSRTVNLGKFGH